VRRGGAEANELLAVINELPIPVRVATVDVDGPVVARIFRALLRRWNDTQWGNSPLDQI